MRHPGKAFEDGHVVRAVIAPALRHPKPRPGLALRRICHLQDRLLKGFVRLSRGKGLGKPPEAFPEGRIVRAIARVQNLLQNIRRKELQLALLADPKSRLQIRPVAVISDKPAAEAVDRRDLRVVDQRALPLQMRVFGVFFEGFADCPPDAFFHLRRGRAGEGDYKEPVDIAGFLRVGQVRENAPHEDGGLAAPRRCAHENIIIPPVNHHPLLICPCHAHSFAPLSKNRFPSDRTKARK